MPTIAGANLAVLPFLSAAEAVPTIRRTFATVFGAARTILVLPAAPVSATHRAEPAILGTALAILIRLDAEIVATLDRTLPAILGTPQAIFIRLGAQSVSAVHGTLSAILRTAQAILGLLAGLVPTHPTSRVVADAPGVSRAQVRRFHLGATRSQQAGQQ
jgi:hypothetical protein